VAGQCHPNPVFWTGCGRGRNCCDLGFDALAGKKNCNESALIRRDTIAM